MAAAREYAPLEDVDALWTVLELEKIVRCNSQFGAGHFGNNGLATCRHHDALGLVLDALDIYRVRVDKARAAGKVGNPLLVEVVAVNAVEPLDVSITTRL